MMNKISCPCCFKEFEPTSLTIDDLTDYDGHAITNNFSEDLIFICPHCKSQFYETVYYETKIKKIKLLEILENNT